ncbi:hypothetical protein RJ639_034095 [Escallonia herrerae]|uniref:Uncharacterized protein n=1 Tax=Escallonia herrerae TaxID=1293975 RepID=A0AA89BJU9_9ASTE|nr:hypothetical protein RJ639_034095 [Escallonia herrerae]
MVVKRVLHMISGNGETSYANNSIHQIISILQKTVMLKAWPVLKDTLQDMHTVAFGDCFKIADLGCSTGLNSLSVISEIIDTICELCKKNSQKAPEFHVSLNDLPDNDFNSIFTSLQEFYVKFRKEKGNKPVVCYISGVPGSFHGRLFSSNSQHLFHSSYSVHWLSQVPEVLEDSKGNIYMARTSPASVFEAYLKQFQMDFSKFLRLRSEEILPRGCMVLTFLGRSIADPNSKDSCCLWELLAQSLNDMVSEGHIKEEEFKSFNIPLYTPYRDEVKDVIDEEGSFTLVRLETFEVNWDPRDNDMTEFVFDKHDSGKMLAKTIRAVTEPLLISHFGNFRIDDLFERYAAHAAEHLAKEKTTYFNIVVSLTKKKLPI